MLIVIGESIAQTLQTNRNASVQNSIREVLFDILYAQSKGRHIVTSDLKTLKYLDQYFCDKKKFFEQEIINKIKKKYSTQTSTFDTIKQMFYVEVLYDSTTINERFDDHIIININKSAKGLKFLELETTLLCEHLADTDFYRYVTEYYISKNSNYSKLHIAFQPFCGGGSAIGACYEYFIESESAFCLAITDSDKKYSGYTTPKSSTSNTITKIDSKNPYNCKHHIIGVRDIENLIPFYMIEYLCPQQCGFIKTELNTSKIDDFILYFDYKLGVNIKKTDYIDFPVLADRKTMFPNVDFSSRRVGKNNNLVIEGFGEDILEKVVDGLDNNSIDIDKTQFHAIIQQQWDEIGKIIFSWCCAIKLK